MERTRRPPVAALVALAIAAALALVAGCAPSDGPIEPSSSVPSASPGPTVSASPGPTMIVRTYFYLGGELGTAGLIPLAREVPETEAVAGAAMAALLAGPTADETAERGITSALPTGSRLLGLSIVDRVATVDLSSDFESGGGSMSIFVRLGQVVYTLTQFPTIGSVVFEIEGRPVPVFSSEGIVLDRPAGRDDFEDQLPAILVDQPTYGAGLGNPARIAGTANVFEAAFLITLLDGSGTAIAQTQVMATCGSGCRGTFDVTLPYSIPEAGWGTLRVWNGSAKDGSPVNVRDYPVWLTPAG